MLTREHEQNKTLRRSPPSKATNKKDELRKPAAWNNSKASTWDIATQTKWMKNMRLNMRDLMSEDIDTNTAGHMNIPKRNSSIVSDDSNSCTSTTDESDLLSLDSHRSLAQHQYPENLLSIQSPEGRSEQARPSRTNLQTSVSIQMQMLSCLKQDDSSDDEDDDDIDFLCPPPPVLDNDDDDDDDDDIDFFCAPPPAPSFQRTESTLLYPGLEFTQSFVASQQAIYSQIQNRIEKDHSTTSIPSPPLQSSIQDNFIHGQVNTQRSSLLDDDSDSECDEPMMMATRSTPITTHICKSKVTKCVGCAKRLLASSETKMAFCPECGTLSPVDLR